MMDFIPRLTRFAAVTAAIFLGFFFLLRLIFWGYFDNPNDSLPLGTLSHSLYIGLKFDLRLALLVVLPLLLIGWVKFLSPFYNLLTRRLWTAYLTLASLTLMLFYVFDFGHFAYLNNRLDATALRFLENPLISAQMVWESYPVIWILLGVGLLLGASALLFDRLIQRFEPIKARPLPRLKKVGVITLIAFLTLFGLYGKVSWYPLRWSDAFFGTHAFASSLALNPALYFYDTYKTSGGSYDLDTVREYYPLMADYLGVEKPDIDSLNYTREARANGQNGDRPNVIIVILESFAAYKSGLSGNPLDPTPYVDAIAKDGIYYPNFYTPSTGTARSVFTTITGMPDIQLKKTSSRNPAIVNQHTLVNAFEGYEKFYFLGGSVSWGNIRGILSGNIPDLNIFEEGSYESPRIDVWGISDIDLFKEANKVLKDQKNNPFFAIIQTSGNHRPYTIPENSEGFKPHDPGKDQLARYGFKHLDEYNSYRFMDHSIGYFMEQVKKEGYFDNTIFAFFGDHGIDGDAGEHAARHDTQLRLGELRVPFIVYAPKLLPGGKVEHKVVSEVDVLASMASIAGLDYTNTTFGRDIFDEGLDGQRYAFTIAHTHVPTIGVVDENYYFRMRADGSQKWLYQLHTDTPRENVMEQQPDKARELETMTLGIYETAKYIRHHNPPLWTKVAKKENQ